MAHIVVLGGGVGGVSCAYELKQKARKEDRITLVSNKPFFQFTPSNPWVAVKWRSKNDITIDLASVLPKHGIAFSAAGGGKGPQFETDAIRSEELGDWTTYQLRKVFRNCSWRRTRKQSVTSCPRAGCGSAARPVR
jgi:glycine/D-amino acid oxidase-like deaminating enzyme